MTYAITDLIVDAEGLAKEWLLSLPSVTGAVGTFNAKPGVFLGMPRGIIPNPDSSGRVTFSPFIALGRSGGVPTGGEVPEDVARITCNCWASSRPAAIALASAVASAAQSLKGSVWTSTTGARIHAARLATFLFAPDQGQPELPRYVVDVMLTVTPS